jgi:hypothetical protein
MQRQLLRASSSPCRVLSVTNRNYVHMDSSSTPTHADALVQETAAQKVLSADNFLQSVPTRAEEQLVAPELGDVVSPLVPLGQTSDPRQQSGALAELDGLIGFLPKPFKHQTLLAAVVRELRLLSEVKTGRALNGALSPVATARGRKMEWEPFTPVASTLSPPAFASASASTLLSPVPHSPHVSSGTSVADDRARQMLMRTATKTSFNSQPSQSAAHSSLLGKRAASEEMRSGSNGIVDLGQIIVPLSGDVASAAAPVAAPPSAAVGHARRKYGIEPIAHEVQLRIILAEGQSHGSRRSRLGD